MASNPPIVPGSGGMRSGAATRYRRSRRSELTIWWREIDRVLLGLMLMLMAIGTVAVAAASPASARRLSTAGVKLDDLTLKKPVQGVVRDTRVDGWTLYPSDVIGRVWVVLAAPRPAELVSKDAVIAFNGDAGRIRIVALLSPT